MPTPPTYVVELTPPGRAAVAVVLAVGPDATRAVGDSFTSNSGRSIADTPCGRIVVGRWGGPTGEELVVCRRSEEEIEIHSHGGAAAVRAVVDALITQGCQTLTWQEWLTRGGVSPRRDSKHPHAATTRVSPILESASRRDATTWAAQIALADATTMRTAAILVDQLNGAFSTSIRDALAAIESADWPQAASLIENILQHREVGLHLTTPWRVVFAGPPNVGKSSLMNALAGYERAIVSPTPGTTRDIVTLTTAIEGWPVELADTAGLRATDDELESAGVKLAETTLACADLAVLVADAADDPSRNDHHLLPQLPPRILRVRNKIDLLPSAHHTHNSLGGSPINTSALTGHGIAELAAAIGHALVPIPPSRGDGVPFMVPQVEVLTVARHAIARQHAAAAKEALQSLLAN